MSDGTVLYFDGVCGLCNRFVDFLIGRDRHSRLQFAPLQGRAAAQLALPPGESLTTVVLVEGDTIRYRSDAALGAIGRVGGPWALLTVLGLVPRRMRDAVYDWVARHRYGWFGVRAECRVPTAEERSRFLP